MIQHVNECTVEIESCNLVWMLWTERNWLKIENKKMSMSHAAILESFKI